MKMSLSASKGNTKPGTVTVTLQRGGTTVILKDVPADVCENQASITLFRKGKRAGARTRGGSS